MKTLLIAASAIALATPAFAQMAPADGGSNTTTQSTTTQTTVNPAAPAEAAPATETVTTETATKTTTVADPKALIASEFPTYDKDGSGTLDKTEFASWMGALKAKTGEKPMPAAEMTKWSDGAFTTADKDKSKSVTLAELTTYLTAGA